MVVSHILVVASAIEAICNPSIVTAFATTYASTTTFEEPLPSMVFATDIAMVTAASLVVATTASLAIAASLVFAADIAMVAVASLVFAISIEVTVTSFEVTIAFGVAVTSLVIV